MSTSRIRWMLLSVAGVLAANLMSATWAKDDLPKAVRSVLAEETHVSRSDWNRRHQLGEELVKAPSSAEELRWHAGFVKLNGKWLPFEESVSPEPISHQQREYLDRRAKAEQSPKSQADLATWCGQHGLSEQSQAHNHRAIMWTPSKLDVSDLYRRMRYVRVGANWLSPYEAQAANIEIRRYSNQLEQWAPACARFAEDLENGRLTETTRRQRLRGLAADEKVPALETILGDRNEASALAAVEAIEQVSTYRATQALGRLAVFSPWLFARDRAIAALKSRKMDEYIPQWMSLAHAPIRTELQQFSDGWNLAFVILAAEEHDSEFRVAKASILAPGALAPQEGRQGGSRFGPRRMEYLRQLSLRAAAVNDSFKLAADISNDKTELLNEQLAVALKETVGNSVGDSPQAWWNWWNEQLGLDPLAANNKRIVIVSEETQTAPPPPRQSCLVAGTPIWTERGLVAVEIIQPGDRVLAKDVETGELAYKVVLHTTVREPSPVTKFAVGDETIRATVGHHFWVSGRGWTKTRELAAEQPLHTPIGIIRVASTESAESAPTYNLVVADFHTYFVGQSAILSHDVLPPKPTNKLVPGLNDD